MDEIAENFARGVEKLNLCPEQKVDGRNFKILGIQSKNRIEWGYALIGS